MRHTARHTARLARQLRHLRGMRQKPKVIAGLVIGAGLLVMLAVAATITSRQPDHYSFATTRQAALQLAGDIARLRSQTVRLEASLDDSLAGTSAKAIAGSYLEQLKALKQTCKRLSGHPKALSQLRPDDQLTVMSQQAQQLCSDMHDVVSYSEQQYKLAAEALAVNSQLRLYQTWPGIGKLHRQGAVKSFKASYAKLYALQQRDSTPDHGTTASMLAALKRTIQANATADRTAFYASLRQSQAQIVAERNGYWRSYTGIADLQKAQSNQLDNLCGYLGPASQRIAACSNNSPGR